VLLGVSLALFLLLPRERRRLLSVPPWIGVVLAFAIFWPVIAWNQRHGWISFEFQLHHGTGGHPSFSRGVEFLGAQLALVTPMLFVLAGIAAFRGGDPLLI